MSRTSRAKKTKLTVSIDAKLAAELRATSRSLRQATSQLVEEAVRLWQRRGLEEDLRRGYLAMGEEDRERAEAALGAQREAIS